MTHKTRTVHSAKTNFSKNGIEIQIVSLGETHLKISSAKYPTFCIRENRFDRYRVGGLVQDCSNSSALAMALMQSCAKPSICDGRLWLGCVISSLAANDSIGSTIFFCLLRIWIWVHIYILGSLHHSLTTCCNRMWCLSYCRIILEARVNGFWL